MKVIELFAGIGAQRTALDRVVPGCQYAISEIDGNAIRSYEAIHGRTENLGDISKIQHLPYCDLLTYSFPCQDLSNAGSCKGMSEGSGTRSALLWEVERLLKGADHLPKILLMENVKAILNKRNLGNFQEWQSRLAELGYHNQVHVLNAKDHGLPQNRERVFMISTLDNISTLEIPKREMTPLKDLLEDADESYYLSVDKIRSFEDHKARHKAKGHGFGWNPITPDGIAHTLTTQADRPSSNFIMYPCATKKVRIRYMTPLECWRLMGFPDEDFRKASAVNTASQLYKQAGNSIAVPCLTDIFIALKKKELI